MITQTKIATIVDSMIRFCAIIFALAEKSSLNRFPIILIHQKDKTVSSQRLHL